MKHVREPEDDHLGRNMSLYKNCISVKKYVKVKKDCQQEARQHTGMLHYRLDL
jgi:hypothetical protein